MIGRAGALALALAASPALAGDPCEALRDRPPRDPYTCECFRAPMHSPDPARVLEERLQGWLESDPNDPWLLAALGGHLLEPDAKRARPALASALTSFVSGGQATGEAFVRILMARDFQRLQRVEDFQRELAAAEALTQKTGDPTSMAWLALIEAIQLGLESRHEEALVVAQKAALAEPFASLPHSLQHALMRELSDSARLAKRFSEALAFARRAAEVCGDSPECRADSSSALSRITCDLADAGLATRADAARRTREAYDAAHALGSGWAELIFLCMLGNWTDPPESIEWNRRCEEGSLALGCPDLLFRAQLLRAQALAVSNPAEIERSIHEVERLAGEQRRSPWIGDPEPVETLRILAGLHKLAAHPVEAIATLEEAIDFNERIRDRQADPESRAEVLSRSAPFYYELASLFALAGGEGDVTRAFATMEALRARTLLDELESASATRSPAPGGPDADELARTVREIAAVQSRLADPDLPEIERDAALQQLDRLEASETDLASRVARANPAWAEVRRPRLAELADVRRRLGGDEALILLQLPPPGTAAAWALVVTAAGERVVLLADFEIGSALPLFLGAIERRAEPPVEMAGAIEQALLSPVIDALPPTVRRLVIVPDGPIARLPLAALPDPRTGRPLIERFELSLAPSATAWLALRGSGTDRLQPAALGLGDVSWQRPTATNDVERISGFTLEPLALPLSRTEVRSMIAAVGGASRALFASRASEAALKQLDLAPFGIVHFAAHAVVHAVHPSRSAILLAAGDRREDGLLQPRDIATLHLAGKLVFLSACRSADGRELRGEGPLSLARVFLGAGARAVVATIWPVRDSEAAALAGAFYLRLARGETASAALAAAQRELSAGGAPPAAWGGFVLFGDGEVSLAPRVRTWPIASTARLVALSGLAGLAVVLAWVYFRKS